MTAKQKAEIVAVIEQYLSEQGAKAQQLMADSHARAQAEAWEAENRARRARELEENPTPEPPADTRPRVVCVKSFMHRGNEVPIGSVWLKDHDCVRSATSAFVDVQE